ncbi:Eco57I restriction-modification methylase domain-containing protein [Burkholderia vietnamiensis]
MERLLAALPNEVFKASDSLGWVYQFWQAKRKDEVNTSEVKIGADELPAVTQLFTEPYMVDFLLHNSLGAWWVTRHPGKACPVPLTYLRTLGDGTPAAGKLEGWPDHLRDFKLLDPCCGSGHFLVAAFLMLVPMRMECEGLGAREAVDAVLRDNLHGLEIDPRCVEIAVFALALAAWRFPDDNGDSLGVRANMPAPQVACCGLKVAGKPDEWMKLVPDDAPSAGYLRQELRLLHGQLLQAPSLGSLLHPGRMHRAEGALDLAGFDQLRELLKGALLAEDSNRALTSNADDEWEVTVTALGLVDAASLLLREFHLVATNVPYLGFRKQGNEIKSFCEKNYLAASNDLATVFIERCRELAIKNSGVVAVVSPQNWLFQSRYKEFRKALLQSNAARLIARLGSGAFETISGEVVKVTLSILQRQAKGTRAIANIDVSGKRDASQKASALAASAIALAKSDDYINAPDYRMVDGIDEDTKFLSEYAGILHGQNAGDNPRFTRNFWEVSRLGDVWEFYQLAPSQTSLYLGREQIVRWEKERGAMYRLAESVKHLNHKAQQWRSGKPNWGKRGVAVSLVGRSVGTLYTGDIYGVSCGVIVPFQEHHVGAIWAFVESGEFAERLKEIDPSLAISVKTVTSVPFELGRWSSEFERKYPNGFPKPSSDNPTQWLFHGHPRPATDPLQVAVARLAGYRWPTETDASIELADETREWIANCHALAEHTDDDGILCLPSVRGEQPAHERLLKLLIAAWETVEPGSWRPTVLDKLLADADCAGKGLDVWLRDKFFEQHAKRFQHRPFIWHVWDGLKDGFAALVNYHQLDAKNLERLIHTYLGDWIRQQEAGVRDGVDGAQTRLAAAQDLKHRLELVLEGEPPYDIFVRWKKLSEQPIGWNPDLNDGVRLNIRPFVTAEVLRHNKKPKLNVSWDKDRGKDVESAPWFQVFKGERINDHHLTAAEKKVARGGK